MDATRLSQIAQWAGGVLHGTDVEVRRVVTDSRSAGEGDLFVALRGARFDAHDFLGEVAGRGVAGVLVERGRAVDFRGPLVEVADTLSGLQLLAARYRKALPVRVVGITGSNGKTSTKDLTHAILSSRLKGWCTRGNLNNHIGVPLTLLSGGKADQFAVVEMGMNHAGEIAPLAAMAHPEVGIITNVGVAHIEHLGSREAIAREKGALAAAVGETGVVVLSAEDDFTPLIESMTAARVVTAGICCGEVQAVDVYSHGEGSRFGLVCEGERVEVELGVPGMHMVRNAAMSAAAALALGLPLSSVAEGLRTLQLSRGRLEIKVVGGTRFLDDSYNANPDSMKAALATLSQWPIQGRRVAVLGRMGELGSFAEEGHRSVGAAAALYSIDWLITLGEEARWISDEARKGGVARVDHFEDLGKLARALRQEIASQEDLVLVKGSRSASMERVIEEFSRL
ncbi:MAG: hypothetical protein RLZZ244_617 [Verrucomicrobiota bacterium]|jgi:UDP-N-acetylmuramoyl-tripeptide--D-alanyl-D-alanine ligase